MDKMNITGSQQDKIPTNCLSSACEVSIPRRKEQSVVRIMAWCRGTTLRQADQTPKNLYLLLTVTVAILTAVRWVGS